MVSQDLQDRRAYLGSYADRYFELLPSGGHQQLPIAPGVAFTENGQRLRLGQGLWATATGAARTRAVTVLDGPAGQIATWGMVTEAGHDAILGVRLKVDDEGLIDEIDTFVVRFNDMSSTFSGSGLLDAQRLARPAPGLLDLVDEGDRPSVAELRRAADGYLDGLLPGRAPNPATAMGVAQQVREGLTRHIAAARDRGMYLTDPSRGLVMVRFFFDHPGAVRGWQGRAPFIGPNSMPAWEVFKVRGGLIRHIEAIIAWFPYGYRWAAEEQQ